LTQTAGVDGLSVEREIGFLGRVAGFHRRWCRRRSATDHNGSPQGVTEQARLDPTSQGLVGKLSPVPLHDEVTLLTFPSCPVILVTYGTTQIPPSMYAQD
jgi:hypothetical protein